MASANMELKILLNLWNSLSGWKLLLKQNNVIPSEREREREREKEREKERVENEERKSEHRHRGP